MSTAQALLQDLPDASPNTLAILLAAAESSSNGISLPEGDPLDVVHEPVGMRSQSPSRMGAVAAGDLSQLGRTQLGCL
jgi:hypothetical protein